MSLTRYEQVDAAHPVKALTAAAYFDSSLDGDEPGPDGMFALVADSGSDGIAIAGTPDDLYGWLDRARAALDAATGGRDLVVTDEARYAYELHQGGRSPYDGWGPDLWALRQQAALVVAVPMRGGDGDAEVYATSVANAIDILMDYSLLDLRYAVQARHLCVPNGKRDKRGLAEALALAGPAHFGDRF